MKNLLFENANISYAGFDSFLPVLVGTSWIGLAKLEDKDAKELLKVKGVKELSDADFNWYESKVSGEEIAYRSFATIKQDSAQVPHATYSEKPEPKKAGDDAKELINVDVVDVEDPLEEPLPKKSKGKK